MYQADPVKTVPQDLLEMLDLLDLLDQKANPELQGMKVSLAPRALEEMMAYQEHQAKMENRDYLDHLVLKERLLIIMPRLQILINSITDKTSNIRLMCVTSYIIQHRICWIIKVPSNLQSDTCF